MRSIHKERLQSFQRSLREKELDGAALVPGTNMFYLTGLEMKLSERVTMFLVPGKGEPSFFAPQLEKGKIEKKVEGLQVFAYGDEERPQTVLKQALEKTGLAKCDRLGGESRQMRLLERDFIVDCLPSIKIENVSSLLGKLRRVKDGEELARMRRAVDLAEEALASVIREIEEGITDREIANLIKRKLLDLEAEVGFGPSVAVGPDSGFPHSQLSGRKAREGDLIWIDMGANHEGYNSDITRTFSIGSVADELQEIYDVVYQAQKKARKEIGPGMTAGEADAVCRDYIEEAGYGDKFIHRTGHGLGLDVHEEPYIVGGSAVVLEPNMTFTVEPGIYLPHKGGVRIEDDVVVTEDGIESLTTFERYLL